MNVDSDVEREINQGWTRSEYPDANHESFYQYPELFVLQAGQFLSWQVDAGTTVDEEERLPFPALPAWGHL